MSSEIERLKEQKRAIERKIRELEHADKNAQVGRARFSYQHYPGCAPDYYYISVRCNKVMIEPSKIMWRSIIQSETREGAIAQIPEVIADLQALYEELKGEENERNN